MRRIHTAAILLVLLTAACSGGADNGNDPASQPGAPSPTEQLVAPQDIEAAGATALHDMGAADWLVMAAGSPWVAGLGDARNQIGRLHGQTGKLLNTVTVPAPVCMGMDVGYGSVWAGSCAPATITRINPETAKVQATIPIDTGSLAPESSLAAAEGAVWVLTLDDPPQLIKIDPQTNKVTARYGPPAGSGGVAADDKGAWLSAHDGQTVWRLPLS